MNRAQASVPQTAIFHSKYGEVAERESQIANGESGRVACTAFRVCQSSSQSNASSSLRTAGVVG